MSEESLELNIIFKLKNQNVLNIASLKLQGLKSRHYAALLAALESFSKLLWTHYTLWTYSRLKLCFRIFQHHH